MTEQDEIERRKAELKAIEAEEANLNFRYNNTYLSGMGTFDLHQDIERVRKRRVELKDVLIRIEVFK